MHPLPYPPWFFGDLEEILGPRFCFGDTESDMLGTCLDSTRAGRGRDERKGLGVAGAVVSDWDGRVPVKSLYLLTPGLFLVQVKFIFPNKPS